VISHQNQRSLLPKDQNQNQNHESSTIAYLPDALHSSYKK